MAEPLIRVTARAEGTDGPFDAKVTVTPLPGAVELRGLVCGEDFCEECGCCLHCYWCTPTHCACFDLGDDDDDD